MGWKHRILAFVNAPEDGVRSSQTLYESLFYLLERAQAQPAESVRDETRRVAHLIVASQLPDGGFDIGYNFRFGRGMEKSHSKEGTTPEVLSLTALALYYQRYEDADVLEALRRGYDWIRSHMVSAAGGYAVPYAPLTSREVHITNATSFALSALACCAEVLGCRAEVEQEIQGMVTFMQGQLQRAEVGGAYWPYFHQTDAVLASEPGADKIDNYHIGQQLYHHCLAHKVFPLEENAAIIRAVLDYLISLQDEDGFIPYTIKSGKVSDAVDTWGFSSTITGFLSAAEICGDERGKVAAGRVADYLWRHAWSGEHFYPIVSHASGQPLDTHFYPRSDAWVLHALAMEQAQLPDGDASRWDDLRRCYEKMAVNDFRGLENHTLTPRKRLFGWAVMLPLALRARLRKR